MTSTWMSPVHGISRGKAYPPGNGAPQPRAAGVHGGNDVGRRGDGPRSDERFHSDLRRRPQRRPRRAIGVRDLRWREFAHRRDAERQCRHAAERPLRLRLPSRRRHREFRGDRTSGHQLRCRRHDDRRGRDGGRDLVANTAITLPAGAAQISGATFQIDFPASLLPSRGRTPDQYGVNLWPRDASVVAGDTQIADFAPDSVDFVISPVGAIPEPAISLLFASGLAGLALARRRNSARRD